ncbi:MAG: hypothetical protein HOP28_07880 [Gemmatimonadales bacterium]|nr:hypothetical protein [Gemmatimonadales bacterium]
MRRVLGLVLAIGAALAIGASAQSPRVGVSVRVSPDSLPSGARRPWVQVRDLLNDARWSKALDEALPIRLNYQVQVWRSRDGWIDELQRAMEWSVLIEREMLQEQYRVTLILKSGTDELRFQTREELARYLSMTTDVDAWPDGTGTFFYLVALRITALSDEDMEELERFLAGQGGATPRAERSPLGRGIRKLLLRLAGLPSDALEARSPSFRVTNRRE